MRKKCTFLCLAIILSSFLIGCWDLTEIEEIGFLVAIGLDPIDNEEEKLRELEKELGRKISRKHEHDQLFAVTFNVAIPSKIEAQEGGRTGTAFFNITTTALTNFKAVRQIAARRSRRLNFEHLKVIVINEDLVRENPMIEHLTDYYIRDHEMRRRTYLYITEKKARDVLENRLPLEEMIATSIVDINENHEAVLTMIPPTTIGEIATNITEESSFLIPRITPFNNNLENPHETDMKITGAAVFLGQDNSMKGWIGEEDTKGYNWIAGDADNAVIEVEYREGEAEFFVFEVITTTATTEYRREKDKNIFDIEIRAEGAFGESWLHDVEISDEEVLHILEKQIEKEITNQATRIIDKMQNEFYADVFGFHQKVKQKEYQYWKTIRDNWDGPDGEFRDAQVNVKAKVKIRHYMLNERVE